MQMKCVHHNYPLVFGAGLCQCPWRWIAERWNFLIHHWLWSDVIDRERNWANGCLVQMCSMQQIRKGSNENHEIKPRPTIILNNNGNDCMLRNCIFSLVCRNSTFHLFYKIDGIHKLDWNLIIDSNLRFDIIIAQNL